MKSVPSMAVVLFVAFCLQAEPPAAHYYVQLILATDGTTPPSNGARLAGPKLSRRFHEILKPKTFWEVRRREIVVHPGRAAKLSLGMDRGVEIAVSGAKRVVTTFHEGRAITRQTIPRGAGMTVIGDGVGKDRLWFVVVRRDEPASKLRRLRVREAVANLNGERGDGCAKRMREFYTGYSPAFSALIKRQCQVQSAAQSQHETVR